MLRRRRALFRVEGLRPFACLTFNRKPFNLWVPGGCSDLCGYWDCKMPVTELDSKGLGLRGFGGFVP